jgi:hypothetical protein
VPKIRKVSVMLSEYDSQYNSNSEHCTVPTCFELIGIPSIFTANPVGFIYAACECQSCQIH